jgi:uncharacterized iron-regulated membrane protein
MYCGSPPRKFHNFPVLARRAIFHVHLWIGVVCGLYILVVCVTGAALVFRIDMQRALYPGLFTAGTPGPLAHPADIMDSVTRAFPADRVSGVDAPTTGRPTYLAYSSQGASTPLRAGNRFRTLLLDPVSGQLLGELNDTSVVRTLQDVHFDLLGGRTGRIVNGIGALLLLTMCLTGLVIWWPGGSSWWRSVRVDFRRSWRRVNWELHNTIGFWTVVVIAMWAVTGLYFVFPAVFRSVVNAVSPITVRRTPQSTPGQRGRAPAWRALIDAAREHAPPGHHVARVVLPSNDTAPFLVMFSDVSPTPVGANLTAVYLDQYTGALLALPPATASVGDTIMAWVVPLHVGNFAGTGVRMLWTLLGLAPPLLFVTGFTMWWTRVVRPRWHASRGAVESRR